MSNFAVVFRGPVVEMRRQFTAIFRLWLWFPIELRVPVSSLRSKNLPGDFPGDLAKSGGLRRVRNGNDFPDLPINIYFAFYFCARLCKLPETEPACENFITKVSKPILSRLFTVQSLVSLN